MAVNDEIVRIILELQKQPGNDAAIAQLEQLKVKAEQADKAVDGLKTGAAGSGQSMLQVGRVIQDFTQGGIGGILNNIEGLTMALGMGSGLAGVLTILGVAAFTAGPTIKTFFKGLIDGSNEIPQATDNVKGLDAALKTTTERLEELRKQQKLTNTELVEFNRLTLEQTKLERELEAARAEKKMEETLTPEQRTGGGVVKRAMDAFGGPRVIAEVLRSLRARGQVVGTPAEQRKAAMDLLFNVQRGDIRAWDALRDVMLPSDIGQVLRGGKTPQEETQLRARMREREAKEAQQAADKKAEQLHKIDEEAARGRQKIAKDMADVRADDLDAEGKRVEEARKISNQLKDKRDEDRLKGQQIDTDKLRPLRDPRGAQNQLELNQILQENQAITASNESILARQLFQSRQIQQRLRNVQNGLVGQQ